MPFDWMHSKPPAPRPGSDQYTKTVRERAQLLCNLQFEQSAAVSRIQAALAWEFDKDFATTPLPPLFEAVPEIVASVYKRGPTR